MIRFLMSLTHDWSIARKLIAAGLALSAALLVILSVAFIDAGSLEDERARAAAATSLMRNHIEADMMHDAMRSTVLAAQIAAQNGDMAGLAQARSDLVEYRAWLERTRAAKSNLAVSPETMALIRKSEIAFDAYTALVSDLVMAASRGNDAIEAGLPKFRRMFAAMETSNEALSDRIEAEVAAASSAVAEHVAAIRRTLLICAALILALVAGFVALIQKLLVNPVVHISDSLEGRVHDDLAKDAARGDEIGHLARSVEEFRRASQMAEEAHRARAAAESERAAQIEADMRRRDAHNQATEALRDRVIAISGQLSATTAQLKDVAQGLAQSADQSRSEARSAVRSADQSLTSVVAIAEATDELLVSIAEISQGVGTAAKSTGEVRTLSDHAKRAMEHLNGTTSQVGRVSVLIGDIAARTRMLALNATIEATHAGEAGRSFAVVAQEVKQLAQQTASAVEEIDALVKTMTGTTGDASQSIDHVWTAIEALNRVTTAIASAAEQQGCAASEIGRTINVTSEGSQTVRHSLAQMGDQVEQTAVSAQVVLDAAKALEDQARSLQDEIDGFAARNLAA